MHPNKIGEPNLAENYSVRRERQGILIFSVSFLVALDSRNSPLSENRRDQGRTRRSLRKRFSSAGIWLCGGSIKQTLIPWTFRLITLMIFKRAWIVCSLAGHFRSSTALAGERTSRMPRLTLRRFQSRPSSCRNLPPEFKSKLKKWLVFSWKKCPSVYSIQIAAIISTRPEVEVSPLLAACPWSNL